MPTRKILKFPSSRLRLKSAVVEDLQEALPLAHDLRDTLVANLGIGLAASQVGINKRIFVVDSKHLPSLKASENIPGVCVLVNPELEFLSEEKFTWNEACLSVSDFQAPVSRYSRIRLCYVDLNGMPCEHELQHDEAGIVQHEADHREGKLFIDHIPHLERRRIMKKFKRKNVEKSEALKKAQRKRLAEAKRLMARKKRKKHQKTFGKNKGRKK